MRRVNPVPITNCYSRFVLDLVTECGLNNRMWQEFKTWKQAIDSLGGPTEVSAMFADVSRNTVSMWSIRGIPAKAWLVLAPKLHERGRFSPALFGMLEPRKGGRNGARTKNPG